MLAGYARVSSVGQSLKIQLDKLSNCEKVFQEKKSGKTDNRMRWTIDGAESLLKIRSLDL